MLIECIMFKMSELCELLTNALKVSKGTHLWSVLITGSACLAEEEQVKKNN